MLMLTIALEVTSFVDDRNRGPSLILITLDTSSLFVHWNYMMRLAHRNVLFRAIVTRVQIVQATVF